LRRGEREGFFGCGYAALGNNHFMIQFSEKRAEAEDWKLTTKKEISPLIQSDTVSPARKPEETQEASTYR